MKYIVKIGWHNKYEFDNSDAAMAYAIISKTHSLEDEDVTIEIVRKEDECRPD